LTYLEADAVIENALRITDPSLKLKRSTTGAVANEKNQFRTSGNPPPLNRLIIPPLFLDNAFDSTSPVSIALKKRSFHLLGIHPYQESWSDGLQVKLYLK